MKRLRFVDLGEVYFIFCSSFFCHSTRQGKPNYVLLWIKVRRKTELLLTLCLVTGLQSTSTSYSQPTRRLAKNALKVKHRSIPVGLVNKWVWGRSRHFRRITGRLTNSLAATSCAAKTNAFAREILPAWPRLPPYHFANALSWSTVLLSPCSVSDMVLIWPIDLSLVSLAS